MMLSRGELVAGIQRFREVYADWVGLDEQDAVLDPRAIGLFRPFRGRVVRAITPWLAEAAQTLFGMCDHCDIERSAWPLVLKLDAFDEAFTRCSEQIANVYLDEDPSGGNAVWRPWEFVVQEMEHPRTFRVVEPIEQLHKATVRPEQIARMYGWFDNGEPDIHRVQREINAPGSEFKADEWVNPLEVSYWQEIEGQWRERIERVREQQRDQQQRQTPEARETLEELVVAKTNKAQILRMKPGCTPEEVDDMALSLGVSLEEGQMSTFWEQQRKRAARQEEASLAGQKARRRQEQGDSPLSSQLSTIETYADLGTDESGIEQRVLKMHEDGHRPLTIATALKNQLVHPLSGAQVGRILAAHRRAQEQST